MSGVDFGTSVKGVVLATVA